MEDTRAIGIKMLNTALKEQKNAEVFEKYIYKKAKNIDEDKREEMYFWFVYQTIGYLLENISNMKNILKNIKNDRIGWNSPCYDNINARIDEHDDYLVHPFDVVEGVVQCPKCGCKKTWSVQRQTRSSDEPMTTFSRCVECKHSWKYAG